MFNLLSDVGGKTALDLACGEGNYMRLLRKAGIGIERVGDADEPEIDVATWLQTSARCLRRGIGVHTRYRFGQAFKLASWQHDDGLAAVAQNAPCLDARVRINGWIL